MMRFTGSPASRQFYRLLVIPVLYFAICCGLQAAPEFPKLTGRVVDNAGLLSPSEEDRLTRQLEEHEDQTTNQVVLVTVDSLQGYDIADFGYQLGRHWGIGQAEHNNGVLLIVAPNERKVRIEVGYGLESTLTDALSKQIIDASILPRFKRNDFPGGIQEGVNSILGILDSSIDVQAFMKKAAKNEIDVESLFNVVIIMVILGQFLPRKINTGVTTGIVFGSTLGLGTWFAGSLILALMAAVFASVFHIISRAPGISSGGGGSGGYGGYSGGGFGGGGFSGGGGGFGGGGASGGW